MQPRYAFLLSLAQACLPARVDVTSINETGAAFPYPVRARALSQALAILSTAGISQAYAKSRLERTALDAKK